MGDVCVLEVIDSPTSPRKWDRLCKIVSHESRFPEDKWFLDYSGQIESSNPELFVVDYKLVFISGRNTANLISFQSFDYDLKLPTGSVFAIKRLVENQTGAIEAKSWFFSYARKQLERYIAYLNNSVYRVKLLDSTGSIKAMVEDVYGMQEVTTVLLDNGFDEATIKKQIFV